ncbi:MAG: D-alanyl-D-alanine carboxypeptidase, partial [Lachnospiraceae bacterium]|nr:D-alanyl-D-alanine carboxypeptidase [Lachnospiraceae bacterium]
MKKFAFLSLLLAMLLLLQGVAMPAVATTSVDPTATGTETASPVGDITVITGCKTIDGMIPLGGNDRMLETAQAAFIYERNTDTILYSYNPDLRLAPGSLMKILTALIAIEQCSLDEEITVNTNSISRLPVGSMTAKLKNGEVITMRDALHLLMLQSANDAALVIAEHVAGSEAAFVKLMNDRVAQMGCTNTVLINCHGLDNAAQYTTARDMVRIIDEAIRNETFKELFGTVSYTMPPTNRVEKERDVVSGNHLIWERDLPQFNDSRVT